MSGDFSRWRPMRKTSHQFLIFSICIPGLNGPLRIPNSITVRIETPIDLAGMCIKELERSEAAILWMSNQAGTSHGIIILGRTSSRDGGLGIQGVWSALSVLLLFAIPNPNKAHSTCTSRDMQLLSFKFENKIGKIKMISEHMCSYVSAR